MSDGLKEKAVFKTKVRRQGSSAITTIPVDVLRSTGLDIGDEVKIQKDGDGIRIEKADDTHDEFMKLHDYSVIRFAKTYKDLAK